MYNLLTRFYLLLFLSINSLSVFAYSYGDPTNSEQFFLELLNRARANPTTEAERLDIADAINEASLPALAFNSQLSQAAGDNSGLTYIQRVENAGYEYQSIQESTATYSFSFSVRPPFNQAPSASEPYKNLFKNPNDRANILSSNFKEMGIRFSSNLIGGGIGVQSNLTAIFASSSNESRGFILGVIYSDRDKDGFYSVGEGIADVQITVVETGEQTLTASAGGYALPLNAGEYNLEFSHPKFQITQTISLADNNVKIDIINPVPYITGYVFNDGESLKDVQITVVETGEQTTTDSSGYYDLALASGHYTLEFSHEKLDKITRNVDVENSNINMNVLEGKPEPGLLTTTANAIEIAQSSAILTVEVQPSSSDSVYFQYGLSSSYGKEASPNIEIGNLQCGTLYHYRAAYLSRTFYSAALYDTTIEYGNDKTFTTLPCVVCDTPPISTQTCNDAGCVWSTLTELDTDIESDTCNYIPIDRFRDVDGNLWKNPVRYFDASNYSQSDGTPFDTTQFAPLSYQNAIEGLFQIRHACQASWYSGQKDLDWIPANIVGAINYCAYPDKISEVVTLLREVANQLACENNLPECNP
ncbi:carboxypeptidase regulatory-like domain-containing protein [Candidatus Albibeggiatoa sp. nov. BB20]|uniref:carboxypeptidase regulatory-like domain-containing protein n=1 Tax=Candidatus Albibeggiatoa sp. nov. BB20 TaxID=3162723 RepID=UPI0033657AE1